MAAIYDYVGVVEKILDTQTVGANGFRKRSIIMTDDVDAYPQYPAHIEFVAKGDRTNLLDTVAPNDRAKLRFAIDSRVWRNPEGKDVYFKDLTVLQLEKIGSNASGAAPAAGSTPPPPPPVPEPTYSDDPGDMPF